MSIEAMKQAIEAWDACGRYPDSTSDIEHLDVAITALRTAIRQAETNAVEPVAWIRRHPNGALSNELLIHVQVEQVRRDSGAWVPLYTHPTPGVPDDVVRDADRLNWLARNPVDAIDVFGKSRPDEARFIRATIDAAMLASPAQKGGE